ncbi:PTS sugar transporter subunit IIA [Siculibacillus lacustris]|uniref:PTS sugar transporter subunit IIA n=1 Tax=Siculibacillus lacustris TaxID=1549641 RepID=A0A4V6MYY8_9HYPH|nr:PTS sugar transporter subunit IIA [Siculibacillus lacustris]TBW33287.1 PTS sugar transporter subunit IIA [Siculibacillus lacustris]
MSTSLFGRYLDPRAICPRVTASDSAEVITLLAERLRMIGSVKESYARAVIDREATMPTGLPLADDVAVAVPHTDPEHVVTPALAMATLATPVAFKSMEDPDRDLAVTVVFALALRDKNEQIEMLQTIAATLQDAPIMRRIAEAATVAEILAALETKKT